ncbi:MAG: alpha/beta hydrolase [Desulfarculaceae bacterium]|nr:alpha/beta hydrolase [Desulfarculaceae bacterium]MCF8073583.1 alpha/beta hydrolase [Desulfarculaceae bacterium]MCF8103740.1 alpha/beta hydrolase [Desulfarculaceae bacterium]MCF8115701.1 alpha/beta hydrolase [Desulfarculaceae bacterium]
MAEPQELMPGVFIEPRIVQTARGPVEVDDTGGELPAVLVSHGGIGGVDQARCVVAWLDPKEYRLICPSRPGFLNTPLSSGPGLEDQADLFAALLDELGVERAAVISVSAGGPPAYSFVRKYPERAWAFMPIDSVSGYYEIPETAGPIAQAIFTSQWGQKLLQKIGEKKPEWFLQEIFSAEAYFTKDQIKAHIAHALGDPQAVEFMRAFMNTMNPYNPRKPGTDNDMALYRELTHVPMDGIACPTLVVHGTHDADVKLYDGVYAHEHIAGSERFWIEEGSHLGFWLSPNAEKAQAAAKEFLARHRP